MNYQHSKDTIELEGYITSLLPNTMFRVKLENGFEILAHISGKMRIRYIKLTVGDKVRVEISKYDPQKGRIIYRLNDRLNNPEQQEET